VATWGGLLDQGVPRAQVVQLIDLTPAGQAALLNLEARALFRGLVGRDPSVQELTDAALLLAQDNNLRNLAANPMGAAALVVGLDELVLDRPADFSSPSSPDVAAVMQLEAGMPPNLVVAAIFGTDEFFLQTAL
jgi:hypothetical protein